MYTLETSCLERAAPIKANTKPLQWILFVFALFLFHVGFAQGAGGFAAEATVAIHEKAERKKKAARRRNYLWENCKNNMRVSGATEISAILQQLRDHSTSDCAAQRSNASKQNIRDRSKQT